MANSEFKPGDLVIVRLAYRRKFNDGSAAAQGKTLLVHGPCAGVIPTVLTTSDQVQIGPRPCDYAYSHELEKIS
jgi:hypothetical protein